MEKKPVIITDRIGVGISACCMGCPVRYNSKGWDMLKCLGREKGDFKWHPVCPESMAGLGVPREPIHISGGDGNAVWKNEATIKTRKGEIVTRKVLDGAMEAMEVLKRAGAEAFVYMEGSPSCGVYRTTLKNQKRGNPPGVFGSLLLKNGFFLIPASDLQSPLKWWDWRRRLSVFSWFKKLEIHTKEELFDSWYRIKFLCQELDEKWARENGRKLAALSGKVNPDDISPFKAEVLELLRKPSTQRKILNSLWKCYSHYRKSTGKVVEDIHSPDFIRNVTSIAKELVMMERTSFREDILFGTSPVIYREQRRVNQRAKEHSGSGERDLVADGDNTPEHE